FAATIALVAVYGALTQARRNGRLPKAHPALRWTGALVLTSLVAGLATAPYSAFHFNQLTRYGLLANVFAVPAMGVLVMPAALLTALLWPLGLDWAGFWLMDLGIAHILRVAHATAALDGSVIPVASGPSWILGAVSLGGLMVVLLQGPIRALGVPVVLVALGSWGLSDRPVVLVGPEGRLVGVQGEAGRILNKARGAAFAARVWLENDGDPVDQATAQSRAALTREKALFEAQDASGALTVVFATGEGSAARYCAENTILITPDRTTDAPGSCVTLTGRALQEDGAHAFYANHASDPVTTRGVTGDRPWTRRR
ncbi:MAG: ComEC/Rec2 family competence protein, partial [Pseudomonadota bacterium]